MFSQHSINVRWDGTEIVVDPNPVYGMFGDSFAWCTPDREVDLVFPTGHPFWMQTIDVVTNPHPPIPACGKRYYVTIPVLKRHAYDYSVMVVGADGVSHSRDPKVIIDPGTGIPMLVGALLAGLAIWGLKTLFLKR